MHKSLKEVIITAKNREVHMLEGRNLKRREIGRVRHKKNKNQDPRRL